MTTQPGEMSDRKPKVIEFVINAGMHIIDHHFKQSCFKGDGLI